MNAVRDGHNLGLTSRLSLGNDCRQVREQRGFVRDWCGRETTGDGVGAEAEEVGRFAAEISVAPSIVRNWS